MSRTKRAVLLDGVRERLASTLVPEIPGGAGFALLVFDLEDGGVMSWSSVPSVRADIVKALRLMAVALETGATGLATVRTIKKAGST